MSASYHRRWTNACTDSNSSNARHGRTVTSSIEPQTYGTSWNSVRWNKSMENGNRSIGVNSHGSRFMSTLESMSRKYDGTNSSNSKSAVGHFGNHSTARNIGLRNSGPSVMERSVRFDGSVLSLTRNRTSSGTSSRLSWLDGHTPLSSHATQFTEAAARDGKFSSKMTSTLPHDKPYVRSTSQTVSNYVSPTPRAERPWRQRMADAARFRSAHSDSIGGIIHSTLTTARAHRNNISNQNTNNNHDDNELESSIKILKNYVDKRTTGLSQFRQNGHYSPQSSLTFISKLSHGSSNLPTCRNIPIPTTYSSRWNSLRSGDYMSRSYSPIRPRSSNYVAALSKFNSLSIDLMSRQMRPSWQSINTLYENAKTIHVSNALPHRSSISEGSHEQESTHRSLSDKKRTLRYHTRKRSQVITPESDSSTGTEHRPKSREKRLRKRLKKKSSNEEKFAEKVSEKSLKEGVAKADEKNKTEEEISEDEQLQCNGIQANSDTSSFSVADASSLYNDNSEMRIIPIQFKDDKDDEVVENDLMLRNKEEVEEENVPEYKEQSTAKVDKKEEKSKKEINLPKKFSFIKKRKRTEENKNKTNDNNKDETKELATVADKKGDEGISCKGGSTENIDVIDENEDEMNSNRHEFNSQSSTNSLPFSNSHDIMTKTSADDFWKIGEHYSAVTRFNPSGAVKSWRSKSKSPIPVPGTWSSPEHREMNISQNKHLQRDETRSNAEVMGTITKKCTFCTIPPLTICGSQSNLRKPVEIALNETLQVLNERNKNVSCQRLQRIDKIPQESINITAKFTASFAPRTRSVERARIIFKLRRCASKKCSKTLKEPTIRLIAVHESFFKETNESNSCRAEVAVLRTPVAGVNFFRCRRRMRGANPRRRFARVENNISRQLFTDECCQHSTTTPCHILQNENVKCISGELGYLQNESLEHEASDDYESLCHSTTPELMQACAVHILKPACEVPYITAPCRSRLGSVEVESVSSMAPEIIVPDVNKMLDHLSYGEHLSSSYHEIKSLVVNRSERSVSLTRANFEFSAPMSPFEQKLQNQALKLHKVSTCPNNNGPAIEDVSTRNVTMGLPSLPSGEYNRPHSTEGTSLTKHFTTAAAAAAQPRQKRYAAHIPITGSGKNERQSATSIVSNNNGVLETATYEVDQMIDQARYRHYQHRSKFKEAIDYLDQIFEDLQKESDQTSKDSQQSRVVPAVPLRKGIASCSKKQQDTSVVQVKLRPHNSTNRSVETMVGLERKVPREMHVSSTNRHSLQGAKTTLSEKCCRHEKSASFEQVAEDVDAQETIVLRPPDRKLKGERMDFTRRWLTGDIKSWASVQPKVDLSLGGLEEEPDVDERSLGSCSAEVAAINSANRKKKARDIPDLIQDVASTAKYVRYKKTNHLGSTVPKKIGFHYSEQSSPLKPQPVKAGALYPLPSSSSRSANSFSQPFRDENLWASAFDNINGNCCLLQKVSSYDRIPKKKQSSEDTLCWGPTSQDPNNALNSIRSTEIPHSIQKTGAFTPVQSSNVVTMYGSVASLSDSSVIRPQLLHSADPVLAINALVAELELNTDQTTVVDKRRSFPTGNEFPVYHDRDHEQPTSDRQALHNDAQSIFKTTKLEQTSSHQQRNRSQKPKKFFDDIPSMLQHVSSSVVPKGPRKIRKSEQKGVSVLSAFETINHEKLNPSKVEALQSMFENKQHAPVWRRNVPSSNHISNNTNKHNCGAQLAAVKDDDNYHEISDFGGLQKESSPICTKPLGKQLSPAHQNDQQQRQISSSQHEFIPAFPVSQPPSHPPGSTNSSQTGGYYSSGSSLGVPSYASHNNQSSLPRSVGYRGSLVEKHSASSRAVSFEDEDDGFYDNIQIEEKRFSHGSELDDMSIGSHRLPPVVTACKPTTNRLGKFLRKISASKPPGSAASLISLNQVASEVVTDAPIPLLKSSSLSHDPWKKQLVENVDNFMQRADVVDKRSGLGQRLKNSIFGSKKRLN